MKIIVGLVVLVALVSGTMLGCQATPSETVYRDVTVGPMTVSIPDDWERPEDIDDLIRDAMGSMGSELAQYYQLDGYGPPSEDCGIVLAIMNASEMVEDMGYMTWEGWEVQMEAGYMTEEDYLAMFAMGFVKGGAEEVSQTLTLHHTIYGNAAVEGQYEYKLEGSPWVINLLLVFAEYDLGIMVVIGEESSVGECEDVWETIRDSVEFRY